MIIIRICYSTGTCRNTRLCQEAWGFLVGTRFPLSPSLYLPRMIASTFLPCKPPPPPSSCTLSPLRSPSSPPLSIAPASWQWRWSGASALVPSSFSLSSTDLGCHPPLQRPCHRPLRQLRSSYLSPAPSYSPLTMGAASPLPRRRSVGHLALPPSLASGWAEGSQGWRVATCATRYNIVDHHHRHEQPSSPNPRVAFLKIQGETRRKPKFESFLDVIWKSSESKVFQHVLKVQDLKGIWIPVENFIISKNLILIKISWFW